MPKESERGILVERFEKQVLVEKAAKASLEELVKATQALKKVASDEEVAAVAQAVLDEAKATQAVKKAILAETKAELAKIKAKLDGLVLEQGGERPVLKVE